MNILEVKNLLKKEVIEKKYLSVGRGTEKNFGISAVKFKVVLADLKAEGYTIYYIPSGKLTDNGSVLAYKVLSAPSVTYRDAYINQEHIQKPGNHI